MDEVERQRKVKMSNAGRANLNVTSYIDTSAQCSGSKFMAILLKGWILTIGGVAYGRVGACSLRSMLVFSHLFLC